MHAALQALAEPHRMTILSMLAERERPAGDFVDALPVSQPTVSKHLSVLREALALARDGVARDGA